MSYQNYRFRSFRYISIPKTAITLVSALLFITGVSTVGFAQSLRRELDAPENVSVVIKNQNGRVRVIVSAEPIKKVTIEGTSAGAPVDPSDVTYDTKGGRIQIDVKARRDQDPIDL